MSAWYLIVAYILSMVLFWIQWERRCEHCKCGEELEGLFIVFYPIFILAYFVLLLCHCRIKIELEDW